MDLVFCVVALLLLNSVASPLGRVGGKGETDQPTINVVCDDGKVSLFALLRDLPPCSTSCTRCFHSTW